jgi:hypothetical protein
MGYQGFVKFYQTGGTPPSNPLILLATGASVNLVLEPIYSTSVWGAGWYNAASTAHYADSAIRYEGSVDFEMQGSDAVWDFINSWTILSRAYSRSLDISPDGARVYEYHVDGAYDDPASYGLTGAWNSSLSISTSEGSFVTVSAGVLAIDRSEVDPDGGTNFSDYSYINQKTGVIADDCSVFQTTNPLNPCGNNVDPIPFWRTNAQLLRLTDPCPFPPYTPFVSGDVPQDGLETVEWSVDLTHNTVVLYTCNGNRLPTAILQGPIDATGSVVLYNEAGVFDPILGPDQSGSLTSPYLYAENTIFRVEIARGSDPTVYLELPAVVVESDDYSITGQDAVTNRTFGLKGLGGRCNGTVTLPPMIMSDSSGAFVGP